MFIKNCCVLHCLINCKSFCDEFLCRAEIRYFGKLSHEHKLYPESVCSPIVLVCSPSVLVCSPSVLVCRLCVSVNV